MITFEEIQKIIKYVTNYAEDQAILLPGRIPQYKRDDLKLLPSSTSKKVKHGMAWNHWNEPTNNVFHKASMEAVLWLLYKLASSCLIFVGLANRTVHWLTTWSINRSEEEKSQSIRFAEAHISLVSKEKNHYRKLCKDNVQKIFTQLTPTMSRHQQLCHIYPCH